jgi:hypothetical protein
MLVVAAGVWILRGARVSDTSGEQPGDSDWEYVATHMRRDIWRASSPAKRMAIHQAWRELGLEFVREEAGDSPDMVKLTYRRPKRLTAGG